MDGPMRWTGLIRGVVLATSVVPPTHVAHAGDGVRLRTPVRWPSDIDCLRIVDRSSTPVWNLPYEIAAEDPPRGQSLTEDELPDGRRHQFFAFSRDIDPRLALPEWITWADAMRAVDAGLADPHVEDAWVMETHPELATSFLRINDDDDRRPITFEAAAQGVDWDLGDVPPGTYVVRAYTFDPFPNLWAKPRPGAIAVVDGSDTGAQAPSLSVSVEHDVVHRDQTARLLGCIRAMEGTTLSAQWAFFFDLDSTWETLVTDVPIEGDTFELTFDPPESLWGSFAVVRVTATDPSGRSYTAYVPDRITVLNTDAEGGDEGGDAGATEGTGPSTSDTGMPDPEGDTTSASTGTTETSAAPGPDHAHPTGGCGCRLDPPRPWGWLLVALFATRCRRARRDKMRCE